MVKKSTKAIVQDFSRNGLTGWLAIAYAVIDLVIRIVTQSQQSGQF